MPGLVKHMGLAHGSVGWVSSYQEEGRQFDSWSGHIPGLPASGHIQEATDQCFSLTLMFLSLSLSPSSPLSKNK